MKLLKRIFLIILAGVGLFLLLTYISVNSEPEKDATNIVIDNPPSQFQHGDSILVAANSGYQSNFLKNIMQGAHYREAWATPVKVPVLFFDTYKGGLTPAEVGGGKQTRSLDLISPDNTVYTLRSVNKYPDSVVPEFARILKLENIVTDGISAQHPYGAILAAALAEKVDVVHTHPQLVYVPQQKALDSLNDDFGDALYLLEYETEGPVNWTKHSGVTALIDTDSLQLLKLQKKDLLQIDYNLLVRSRLFDLIIGDWDRHTKQWGWALQQRNDTLFAIPVAGDRDNAFFSLDGVIPTIISSEYVEPHVRPFDEDIDYLPGLVYPFDVYFLKEVPRSTFAQQAAFLQQQLTDEVIEEALRSWPEPIYKLNNDEIRSKLRSRRDQILEYALEFHKILQEKEYLNEPLKGSDDITLPKDLLRCFNCN